MTDRTVDRDPATDSSDADTRRIGAGGCSPASVEWPASCFSWWGRDARCRTARRLRSGDGGRAPDRRGDRSPRSDYVVLAVFGLLAVVPALLLVAAQRVRGVSEATPPAVEGVLTASYPGASFDHAGGGRLRRFRSTRSATDRRRRLREAAVRATMRAEGCSRTDAERRVDEGTWTNDSVAASSLSASGRGVLGGTLSALEVTRDGDPADRTVDAILAKTTGKRSVVRGSDRDGNEDLTAATVRNSGRGTDRDADRDANRASDRRSDERSTAQEGAQ